MSQINAPNQSLASTQLKQDDLYDQQQELERNSSVLTVNATIKDVKEENQILQKLNREITEETNKRKLELEQLKQQYKQLQEQIIKEKELHKSLDDEYYQGAMKKSQMLIEFQE